MLDSTVSSSAHPRITRRALARTIAAGLPAVASVAFSAPPPSNLGNPGTAWARFPNAEAAGFRSSSLAAVEQALYPKPTTSLMVVKSGKIAFAYGDIAQVSYLASARKSVLSILYGKHVAAGTIPLNRTVGDLGIDEGGEGLLPLEKTATVRHLLMSSSGVYWPAGSPGGNEQTPPRGSKTPGAYFHYNNWDFNVAGAVFEQLTGKTVFKALAADLAAPLQFQDFDESLQRMLGYRDSPSRYKAYHMFLSARDMARLGVLMINGGRWNGQQIVPATWVKESTAAQVRAVNMVARSDGNGYGYLWWIPSETRTGDEWAGSFLANGNYGQFILVLPALDTVIVHRRAVTDDFAIARNLGQTQASPAGGGVSAADFLKIADMIVAARSG